MRVHLIRLFNGIVLMIILIGLPAITSLHFGSLRITADPTYQRLTIAALGLATGLNIFLSIWPGGPRRVIRTLRQWAAIHAAFLITFYLAFHDYLDFTWLKDALLWLQNQVS